MKNTLKKIGKMFPVSWYGRGSHLYHQFFDRMPAVTALPSHMNSNLQRCYEWFQSAAHYIHVNRIEGVYAEFGSHEVNTFRCALNTLGNYRRWGILPRTRHFFAFDSFEGMPEPTGIDRQKIWRRGMNFTSEEALKKICSRDKHRMTTVKGFYEDSLPKYPWNPSRKISLAYIDCDYYSSTVEVLKFIRDKMAHGAIIAFDDWNCYYGDPQRGQKKAFSEFQKAEKNHLHFEPFLPISFGGMSFLCLQKDFLGKEIL